MSETSERPTTVEEFVRRALPGVNRNLDWEVLTTRYDPDPVGNTLGMVLYQEGEAGAEQVVEAFGFAVIEGADGPEIEVVPYGIEQAADPSRVLGLGDVITYRRTALNVLNPDTDLTPQKACYQRGEVDLNAADPLQKRRVWLVSSAIMEMITRELDNLLPSGEAM